MDCACFRNVFVQIASIHETFSGYYNLDRYKLHFRRRAQTGDLLPLLQGLLNFYWYLWSWDNQSLW